MGWLITPLHVGHGIGSGIVVACSAALILSCSCFKYSVQLYTPCAALFLNQSKT
jgi:hypothetical protein